MKKENFYFDLQRFAEDPVEQETITQPLGSQETDEVKKDPVVDQVKDTTKKEEVKNPEKDDTSSDEQNLDKIINEKFDLFKSNYETKIKELEKARRSLDQKVSEQRKKIENYEKKEMTEEQIREMEKKDRIKEWHTLYVAQAIAENNLKDEEDGSDFFKSFLHSNEEDPEKMKEEIYENAELLKGYLDRKIAKGVEKGINERLASGSYIPKQSGKTTGTDDLENMTKDDIGKKITEIMRTMPAGADKDALIAKYMAEQQRRFSQ